MDERERLGLRVRAASGGLCAHLAEGNGESDEARVESNRLAASLAAYRREITAATTGENYLPPEPW